MTSDAHPLDDELQSFVDMFADRLRQTREFLEQKEENKRQRIPKLVDFSEKITAQLNSIIQTLWCARFPGTEIDNLLVLRDDVSFYESGWDGNVDTIEIMRYLLVRQIHLPTRMERDFLDCIFGYSVGNTAFRLEILSPQLFVLSGFSWCDAIPNLKLFAQMLAEQLNKHK